MAYYTHGETGTQCHPRDNSMNNRMTDAQLGAMVRKALQKDAEDNTVQASGDHIADLFAEYLDARWDFDYAKRKQHDCDSDGYIHGLYKADADKAFDRMWDAEQALEALGIDIRSAVYRRDKAEKQAA